MAGGLALASLSGMRAIAPLQQGQNGAPRAPATSRRAIEKTSASSALGDQEHQASPEREKSQAPLRVELVCRDETTRFDPFWDAPRLLPTFVTQLLGQAMPQRHQSASVETAYGRAASPRAALFVDRKS